MTQQRPQRAPLVNPHLLDRMARRGISADAIDWVIENYHTQHPAEPRRGAKPAVIYRGTYNGRELKVYSRAGLRSSVGSDGGLGGLAMSQVTYDAEADVLYVELVAGKSATQKSLGDLRIIDYSDDGAVLGVEFIGASDGVELHDVPFARKLAQLIDESGLPIKVFA